MAGQPSLTDAHTIIGCPHYMSPEQIRDPRVLPVDERRQQAIGGGLRCGVLLLDLRGDGEHIAAQLVAGLVEHLADGRSLGDGLDRGGADRLAVGLMREVQLVEEGLAAELPDQVEVAFVLEDLAPDLRLLPLVDGGELEELQSILDPVKRGRVTRFPAENERAIAIFPPAGCGAKSNGRWGPMPEALVVEGLLERRLSRGSCCRRLGDGDRRRRLWRESLRAADAGSRRFGGRRALLGGEGRAAASGRRRSRSSAGRYRGEGREREAARRRPCLHEAGGRRPGLIKTGATPARASRTTPCPRQGCPSRPSSRSGPPRTAGS